MSRGIELAAAIRALRHELAAAMSEGEDESLVFRLATVELTIDVTVAVEGNGKIGWQVLGLGAGASREVTHAQTLQLSLTPMVRDAKGDLSDAWVSRESPGVRRFGTADRSDAGRSQDDDRG